MTTAFVFEGVFLRFSGFFVPCPACGPWPLDQAYVRTDTDPCQKSNPSANQGTHNFQQVLGEQMQDPLTRQGFRVVRALILPP